ncbi:Oxidoreductase [Saccharomyces pastorianus]|nr:Oxidoreductase [Saccharomyces pastorianus]
MASSPQFGKSYDSKQEKTAGFIMGILSMAGALYFITPNRKPLFASRKVESDKTAEEEISRGEEQSPDNGNGDESQTEAGAQLGGDQIGASKVAEDGELVVLADQDDNAAGEKEAVETKDDEQLRDGENKSEETKDSNESAEISEEGADAKSQDDHDIKSSKNTDFESLDEEKPEEAQSFDKETTKAADGEDEVKEQDHGDLESEKHPETSAEDKEALRKQEEKQMGATEEEVQHEGAYNPDTGEINWDCPCLGGMAHGPCGEEFKSAFSCFVYSEAEPKGIDCVEKFQHMQDCFRKYPEHYEDQLKETSDDEETQDKAKVNTMESAPNVSSAKENAEKKAEKSDVKKESLDEKA